MRVEQTIELGESDPKLEIPWAAAEPNRAYFDLRDDPRAITCIEPAQRHSPLRAFLVAVNSEDSAFATLRCRVSQPAQDAATSASGVFSSEIDLAFAETARNGSRASFEELSRRLAELLEREGGGDYLNARLSIRRCRFAGGPANGHCLSVLLTAQGETREQAELRWGLALARVQQALLFLSRMLRQKGAGGTHRS